MSSFDRTVANERDATHATTQQIAVIDTHHVFCRVQWSPGHENFLRPPPPRRKYDQEKEDDDEARLHEATTCLAATEA